MATIEETIQSLIPQLTEEVAAKIRERCLSNLEYKVSEQVQAAVNEHIATIIIPAVKADLAAHEEDLKAAVIAAVKQVGVTIGAALVEHATKKLASYEGDKLLTQMLGPLFRGY